MTSAEVEWMRRDGQAKYTKLACFPSKADGIRSRQGCLPSRRGSGERTVHKPELQETRSEQGRCGFPTLFVWAQGIAPRQDHWSAA